MPAIN